MLAAALALRALAAPVATDHIVANALAPVLASMLSPPTSGPCSFGMHEVGGCGGLFGGPLQRFMPPNCNITMTWTRVSAWGQSEAQCGNAPPARGVMTVTGDGEARPPPGVLAANVVFSIDTLPLLREEGAGERALCRMLTVRLQATRMR